MEMAIATAALLFTIASFWWMNWRPANIKCSQPRPVWVWWGRTNRRHQTLIVAMPLVLWNEGARPGLVVNLRLIVREQDGDDIELSWMATFSGHFAIEDLRERDAAAPFALSGNEVLQRGFEFQAREVGNLSQGHHLAKIEMSSGNREWEPMLDLELEVSEAEAIAIAASKIIALKSSI